MTSSANTLLALRDDQREFSIEQYGALVQLGVQHANQADLAVFFHQCRRTGLDPFAKQIYMIGRESYDPAVRAKVWKQTIQVAIGGFQLIARRAADRMKLGLKLDGPEWLGYDGEDDWKKAWTDSTRPPLAARSHVSAGDNEATFVALYAEYVPLKDEYTPAVWENNRKVKDGEKTGRQIPSGMWGTRPASQLFKCAQAGALRSLFPQDLSGIYVPEEMEHEDYDNGKVIDMEVTRPASPESETSQGEARDWLQELALATTGEQVNEIWAAARASGQMTKEIEQLSRKRGREIRDQVEAKAKLFGEERGECILTGADGEDLEDHETHDHAAPLDGDKDE